MYTSVMQTTFIPTDLKIDSLSDIQPYFDKLLASKIKTLTDLKEFLVSYSAVLSVYHEQSAWSYINMTRQTDDKNLVERHEMFSSVIGPEVTALCNKVQKKIAGCPHFEELDSNRYAVYKRCLKRELELFRNENVPLEASLAKLSSEYSQLAGSLLVEINGQKMPVPKAGVFLQSSERETRKKAWFAIQDTYQTLKERYHNLLSQMIALRDQVAKNTGYANFRDYQHDNLQRFDYGVNNVLAFHDAILEHVVPFKKDITLNLAKRLELTGDLRPWDTAAKPSGEPPLKPFATATEFLDKTINVFSVLNPQFGKNIAAMRTKGLFDLESRQNKAPGGYNCGLEVTGMPFIFMNAAGIHRDLITLMHEGGHAMQSFLMSKEPLIQYRNPPSEVAETASMSMELISSSQWHEFYDSAGVKRARREHLEDIIDVLPWVAIVDGFQHWLYTNPKHTPHEREDYFDELMLKFGTGIINWNDLQKYRRCSWLKQLHIFEVPFYYIEYAIAQLGALQIYQNFKHDPKKAIANYIAGLALGSSRPIPEIWQTLGIKFDFSSNALRELMNFARGEWKKLIT